MSLRDDIVPVVDMGRQLAADLGLRQRVVQTRLTTWSGGKPGSGTASHATVTLSPPPVVEEPPARLVNDTAGQFQSGDILITKVSADYDEDDLTGGTLGSDEEWAILVDGKPYRLVGVQGKRNFEYRLHVRAIRGR